jgi:hypothetical protein
MKKVGFILSQGVQKRGISFTLPDKSKLENALFSNLLSLARKAKHFFIL